MRTQSGRPGLVLAAVLLAVAGLAACTPNGGPAPSPSASTATGTPTGPSPTQSPTAPSGSPSPSATPLPSGPGQGNAKLDIVVKPSETASPTSFTLVCHNGIPAAESHHPDPAAACLAIKKNPSILTPAPPGKTQACTQQYGGPQVATVTGVVDGRQVQSSFSLKDGCEIAAWNAAKAVLGSSGGAS
jgi:hypothetical protein